MTQDDKIQANRELAQYLGWKNRGGSWYEIEEPFPSDGRSETMWRAPDMKFENSWDWIMRVVDKIENGRFEVIISSRMVSITGDKYAIHCEGKGGSGQDKLQAVYETCVRFVRDEVFREFFKTKK